MSETATPTAAPLLYESRVKDFLKTKECRSTGDLTDTLSKMVESILEKAVLRAKENGRSTIKPCDL